jgi:hypothetical protein
VDLADRRLEVCAIPPRVAELGGLEAAENR